MDFLEKLNYLMKKNHLNKNTLSKACNIPYTTIDGWYKKGYEGLKLTTLRKLAEFFGTSLDYWASEDTAESLDKRVQTMKPRYCITVDDEMLKEIDDFRFSNGYNSRSQATLELIRIGMEELEKQQEEQKKALSTSRSLKLLTF